MGREYLAARLMSADPGVPVKTSWWPRHCRIHRSYLDSVARADVSARALSVNTSLECAGEFELSFFGHRNGIMVEHVQLELDFVRAAYGGDAVALEQIGRELDGNARRQVATFNETVKNFPSTRYAYLLSRHLSGVMSTVSVALSGGEAEVKKADADAQKTTIALAGLMTEWF